MRAGREPEAAAAGRAPHALVGAAFVAALALSPALPGCVPPQLLTVRGGLDSLRAVVDTMNTRDSVAFVMLTDMRREVAEQRDILLSTRATTGSTTQEMFDQMTRLQGKLDEVMGRFSQLERRAPTTGPVATADPKPLFDQASQDLTQGRYSLALPAFREYLTRAPSSDLADNAQYGIGECFFAQSMFDSAAVEYARVPERYPDGERVPAALYKLALSQDKLGRGADSRKTLEDLVKRFPLSGEAQLARERLGRSQR
jgi:tol-pal system protein YbgF